jgi:hypothetical protein
MKSGQLGGPTIAFRLLGPLAVGEREHELREAIFMYAQHAERQSPSPRPVPPRTEDRPPGSPFRQLYLNAAIAATRAGS